MRKAMFVSLLLSLFASMAYAQQEDNLPPLLKERRSGKVMFDREKAKEEIQRQRLAQSNTIWTKWGGKPCPEFSYTDLGGVLWNNENIHGKVTVIHFWHITSGPCIRQIPWLNKLYKKYPDMNFLACTFNETQQVKTVVAANSFLFHQLTDALPLWHTLGVIISPTTLILDQKGEVFAIITGTNETLKHRVEAKLRQLND